jgi:hypothetical protein
MKRDPELVIQQALRAQAGGPRRPDTPMTPQPAARSGWPGRFTTVQVVLLAAIIGLVVGMAAAFAVLLVR